jgi:hypothetical protein
VRVLRQRHRRARPARRLVPRHPVHAGPHGQSRSAAPATARPQDVLRAHRPDRRDPPRRTLPHLGHRRRQQRLGRHMDAALLLLARIVAAATSRPTVAAGLVRVRAVAGRALDRARRGARPVDRGRARAVGARPGLPRPGGRADRHRGDGRGRLRSGRTRWSLSVIPGSVGGFGAVRRDPRLPVSHLPADWPAVRAQALFRDLEAASLSPAHSLAASLLDLQPDAVRTKRP